jgi:hypothetical protein
MKVVKHLDLSVVKISECEFDIEFSISLVEAMPVLWDKMNGIYATETKR